MSRRYVRPDWPTRVGDIGSDCKARALPEDMECYCTLAKVDLW